MKLFNALKYTFRRPENVTLDRLNINLTRKAIESNCEKYLKNASDILVFEALPEVINETLEVLSMKTFQDKWEFEQISESCFKIKQRELYLGF